MSRANSIAVLTVAALLSLSTAAAAFAQEQNTSKVEVSLLGGIHAFNKNDTALGDNMLGVPAVAGVAYRLTPNLAAEGEFTWLIPVKQSVDVGVGSEQDRKAPQTLAYQVGLRGNLQLSTWSPYLAAGVGAMTFLSNDGSDALPRLDKSQTVFALNFGAGSQYAVNPHWGLRADFREFVGFPGNDTAGLSANGSADPIWIERGTIGLDYRF
jgi:opacity protein-like surface antigen